MTSYKMLSVTILQTSEEEQWHQTVSKKQPIPVVVNFLFLKITASNSGF